MERIDKVISNQSNYSRKDIKDLIKKKRVKVNGETVLKSDIKINSETDIISIDDIVLKVQDYVYLILNKPKGYVSATEDKNDLTVLDLVPDEYLHRDLFPAGRLDKDTTGMMIITDDGVFAHEILSPKKHVKKTYEVMIDKEMTNDMVLGFKNGVLLNDGVCKTANLEITGDCSGIVTLTEGRYHQIKRMFGCFGAKVIELKRVGMGELFLPDDLLEGECRELSTLELELIKKVNN